MSRLAMLEQRTMSAMATAQGEQIGYESRVALNLRVCLDVRLPRAKQARSVVEG
jgi:hypothetical protein